MDSLCRLCTGNVSCMEFMDLFENIDLMEKVEKHLQIKCSQDEFALPHKICNSCIYELDAFVNFFERCHSVQKALKIQSELYSNQDTDKRLFKGEKIDTSFHKDYVDYASNNIDENRAIVSSVSNRTPLLRQLVRHIKSEAIDTCMSENNLPSSEIVAKVIVGKQVKEEVEDDQEVLIIDSSDGDNNDLRYDVINVDDSDVLVEEDTSKQTNKTEGVINSSESCNQPPDGEWCRSVFRSSENGNKILPNSGSGPSNTSASDDSFEVIRRPISRRRTRRRIISSPNTSDSEGSRTVIAPSYKCGVCEQIFKRKVQLALHLKNHSTKKTSEEEKQKAELVPSHNCGVCDRVFKRKVQLDLHLWTHSSKKTSYEEEESDVYESSGSEFSCEEENRSTKKSVQSEHPSKKYELNQAQAKFKQILQAFSDHSQKQQQKETAQDVIPRELLVLAERSDVSVSVHSDQISNKASFDCHQDKVLLPSQHSIHQNRVQQPSPTVKRSFQSILPYPVTKPKGVQSVLKNSQVSQNSYRSQQTRNNQLESLPKQSQPQVLYQFIPVSSSQPHQYQSSPVSQVITTPGQVTSSSPQVLQIQNSPGLVLVGPFSSLPTLNFGQSFTGSQLAQQSQNSRIITDVSSSQQNTQISQVAPSQQSSVVQVIQTTPHLQKGFPAFHQLRIPLNNGSSSASEQTAQITQVVPQQTTCVMPSTSQSYASQQGNIIALSPYPVSHTSTKTLQSSVQSPQIVPSTVQSQTIYIGQSSTQSQVTYRTQHPKTVHVLPSSLWTSSSTQSQGSQKFCNSQILEAISTVPHSSSTQSQLLLPSPQSKIVVASSHQQLLQIQEHNVGQQHQHVQPSHTILKTTQSQEQSEICRSFQQSQIMPIIQSVQDLQPLQISQLSNSKEHPESSVQSLVSDRSNFSGLKQTMKSLQCEVGQPPPKFVCYETVQPLPKYQHESNETETELLCMEVVESDSDNDMRACT